MAVSIEDIVTKEFSRSLMGYDTEEVDVFLDAIISRMEKMETEREELVTAMEKLLRRVERMEKVGDGEKRALESGEKPARKHAISGASAAGPVHVQGTAASEKTAARAASAQQPAKKRAGEALRTDAPLHTKPIRPAAQPGSGAVPSPAAMPAAVPTLAPEPDPVQPATAFATPADLPQKGAAQSASEQSVAIEVETGSYAPDVEQMIPDLLHDIENTLLDGSIRSASHQDTPVRAADQSRVS